MNITAWIIALDQNNPTALELKRTLREQGIEADIREAVDGRQQFPILQGQERLSQRKALLCRLAPLTSSEVGCYLSHYRLIFEAYNRGLSHICLFEDDVVAEPGVGQLIRDIAQLDDKAHLVRLMSLKIRTRKIMQELSGGYTLTWPLRGALGTQGYVLNRIGMKKILDFGSTIYMPIDKLYDSFFLYGLNCFSVEPHALYELSRSTNVRKSTREGDNPPFYAQLPYRFHKLYRSVYRYRYFLTHIRELLPASKPTGPIGKSKQIR